MSSANRTHESDRIELHVTTETKALFARAAAMQGQSLTEFVVQSTVEAARRTIRESEYLDLSQRDRMAFVEAVLDPPPPSDRLMQAAERHKQMFGQ